VQPKDAIRHVVIIFQENVSFDHYFATYPHAVNLPNEPRFVALPGTPTVDGLSGDLLTRNPNSLNPDNGAGAANPFRLRRDQAGDGQPEAPITEPSNWRTTTAELDLFPKAVGAEGWPAHTRREGGRALDHRSGHGILRRATPSPHSGTMRSTMR